MTSHDNKPVKRGARGGDQARRGGGGNKKEANNTEEGNAAGEEEDPGPRYRPLSRVNTTGEGVVTSAPQGWDTLTR